MGKTAEEDQQDLFKNRHLEEYDLPIKVPDEMTIQKLFPGMYIACHEDKIIAIDTSLENLHEKCDNLLPEGEGCLIDYVEESVGIYGFKV